MISTQIAKLGRLAGIVCVSCIFYLSGAWGLPYSERAASLGFSPAALRLLDADIVSGKYGHVDSLLILRHGVVAFDRTYAHNYAQIYGKEAVTFQSLNALDPGGPYNYFNPWWHPYYRGDGRLHTLQSVTKTVNSIIIGVAVTRGEFPSLDTPVVSFFDAGSVAKLDERKQHLTIRHLLTMTVGMAWNADVPYSDSRNSGSQMEASADWVKFFINQPMAEEPGRNFYYNDGAPQALAYIFRKATGRDMEEYAAAHLFAPLGINSWFWKRTPQGLPDGEGGLFLDRHDLAKLMLLFEHGGLWNGKKIVGSDWVEASLTPAVDVKRGPGTHYGYLWWLYPYGDGDPRLAFGGAGFGGQLPIVMRDEDIIIVANAWNVLEGPSLKGAELIHRVRAALVAPHL